MDLGKLKTAEERFLIMYPGGFNNPQMLEIAKKHKAAKLTKLAQDAFSIEQFESPSRIVDAMSKIISQSAMISVFEKPKFRDMINAITGDEKERLSTGLKEFLHGDQGFGFELILGLLGDYKLAKWPLLTICPFFYRPDFEVFIKPTTAKSVIEYFELEGIKYSSKPSLEFYIAYREHIKQIKNAVSATLQVDNAAFCGFLMMAMEK